MRGKLYFLSKRLFDVTGAAIGLCLLSLPLAGCVVAIRMTSRSTGLFRQVRIGRDGRPFVCYKLRTMRADAPSCAAARLTNPQSYVTPLGAILRRISLDEAPQLYNILRGDMSFVGPRPLIPEERELHRLRQENGVYRMRPGLSGLSQISGRDTLPDERKARLDAVYADAASPMLDLSILWKTLGCIRH